jgi:monofunctional biosynthetic peptidoglycan transglycosylase
LLLAHWAFFLYIGLFSLLLRFADPPLTALMMHRALVAGHPLRSLRPLRLGDLPQSVPRMFVKVEDYVFYEHFGIDWKAIRDAYRINRRLGYVYYGGSTITQQLARTLFLVPDRTYLRKYLEALAAVEMELLLPKARILELYVNTIEFGKGVFGLGAAAQYYYGRNAGNLGRDQYRRLVTIIASPLKYTVNTFGRSRALAERYRYLSTAFPDS